MATLIVPRLDDEPWPTLGDQLADFLVERSIYGPGSLKGEPYEVDAEFRAILCRLYEVYPRGHELAGRRRFKRGGITWRKGMAKTEKMAQIAYLELHPESPVRCDGFDAYGQPAGRPVRDPYIPLLAVTVEQVEELAYGALKTICEDGPDSALFDASLERIVRLDERGRADGKAVPLSNSPGARDGARTTFQGFDEPHRLILPRQKQAHETMSANLAKRVLDDPWSLYVGTAGEPGENSVAEDLHAEAEAIDRGEIADPQLSYFARWAGGEYDLDDLEQRIAAVREATGPAGEWGPGQFRDIALQWDRPKADRTYLERTWLNRWTRSGEQAFSMPTWAKLCERDGKSLAPIAPGSFVAVGFDGARFRDSTALVITDIPTGIQQLWGLWERPLELPEESEWEVSEDEVTASLANLMDTMQVWKLYGDPPHWTETMGSWSGRHPDQIVEWWTNRIKQMAYAIRDYSDAMTTGSVGWSAAAPMAEDLTRHIGNAGRKPVNLWDDDGKRLHILQKIHPLRKFDGGMAACLSWQARLDALKQGAKPKVKPKASIPRRIR